MEGIFVEGLLLQASLIFALGAQNLFVLECGIKKQHPLIISFMCFLCDFTLIMVGVAGAGSVFSNYTQLKILIGIIGVLFLLQYGLSKILLTDSHTLAKTELSLSPNIRRSIVLAITFSIINPHAYLDAFVLIGGYSTKYSLLSDRLMIGCGAAFFSLLWFILLSHAPSVMKPVFSNHRNLRIISTCSGLVLLLLSFRLGWDVYGWIINGPHSPVLVKSIQYPLPSGLLYSSILY